MGIHDGHRERVLAKFAKNGFAGLEEHEKLEIILFFSIPRTDTNAVAHELLGKYRSIANVMDAPEEELIKFKNVTGRTAYLFKMIKEASAVYELEKSGDKSYMTSTDEFGTYFQLYLANAEDEKLVMMCLDSRGKVLCVETVAEGDIGNVTANSRRLLEIVLRSKATEVVLAHNHPGNVAFPSAEDVKSTEKLGELLAGVGVYLKDHFIVTRDDFCSMAKCERYNRLFGL